MSAARRSLNSPSATEGGLPTISDSECVAFLQWAMPRLRMRWPGFRKVRRRVRKRIRRRMIELGLSTIEQYRACLEGTSAEWAVLDEACRILISRFYRDRSVFDYLRDSSLPELAQGALEREDRSVRCWSAGCAGGEEPYSLALIWELCVQPRFPDVSLIMQATDSEAASLTRARRACYGKSSLIDLPGGWRERAFTRSDDEFCVRQRYRNAVTFMQQDIRHEAPQGSFDLVLCRNLVLTYFDEPLQLEVPERITRRIRVGGYLVIGKHEFMPRNIEAQFDCVPQLQIFRRRR